MQQQELGLVILCQLNRVRKSIVLTAKISCEGDTAKGAGCRRYQTKLEHSAQIVLPVVDRSRIKRVLYSVKKVLRCAAAARKNLTSPLTGAMAPELVASEIFRHERGAYTGAQETRAGIFEGGTVFLDDVSTMYTKLTNYFLTQFSKAYGKSIDHVARETYRCFRRYSWPRNVRELKNVIHTAVVRTEGRDLTPDVIPQRIRDGLITQHADGDSSCCFPVGATLGAVGKELIRATLASVKGNKKLAASILGISRRALYNKVIRHGLT